MASSYHGWADKTTWNAALYINNDYGFYKFCKSLKHNNVTKWADVAKLLTVNFGSSTTPDGQPWALANAEQMERMLAELD